MHWAHEVWKHSDKQVFQLVCAFFAKARRPLPSKGRPLWEPSFICTQWQPFHPPHSATVCKADDLNTLPFFSLQSCLSGYRNCLHHARSSSLRKGIGLQFIVIRNKWNTHTSGCLHLPAHGSLVLEIGPGTVLSFSLDNTQHMNDVPF